MDNILSDLPKIISRRKKRLGRGLASGKGSKSTRGTSRHQKARESIPLHFEGGQGRMIKKFPHLRGKQRNKSIKAPAIVVSFNDLNRFEDGTTIDRNALVKKNIIDKDCRGSVKILANGKLEKKLIIKLPVSGHAKKIIEDLGGKVDL